MGVALAWFSDNWFSTVQSAGIIGGLLLATLAARQEARTRRSGTLLALTSQHRELWSEVHRRPELARILQKEVDLVGLPMTVAEEEFLNTVFVHVQTGWELARRDGLMSTKVISADMRNFLSHPLPRLAWERRRTSRAPRFVAFMDASTPNRQGRQG